MADDRWVRDFWKSKAKVKEAIEVSGNAIPRRKNPKLPVEVIHQKNTDNFFMGIKQIGSTMLLIGIPGDTPTGLHRRQEIQGKVAKLTGKSKVSKNKKKKLISLKKASDLGNAYLLALFEKGSPLNRLPARSVLKAAIFAPWNKKVIADLIAKASKAQANGKESEAKRLLKKAGIFAAKACREWFDDPRNGWPRNAPSTISHKGFDRPGVFSGAMKDAITYIMREVENVRSG